MAQQEETIETQQMEQGGGGEEMPVAKEPQLGTYEASHMVIAPMEIPAEIFDSEQTGITWIPMINETAVQIAEFVVDQLESAQPRCITILALQNTVTRYSAETVEDIKRAIDTIVDTWQEHRRHRVAIATLIFCPDEVEEWANVAEINDYVMRANQKMKMQPLRLHRIFLTKQKDQGVMVVNGGRFLEFEKGQGLGSTPTMEALRMMAKWILLHHRKGMFNTNIPSSNQDNAGMQPTPLGYTDGYYNNKDMATILKQRGQFVSRRTRSTSRRRVSTSKPPAKRVLSAEQGRTPLKQRVNSVDEEPPSQILVREMTKAYKQNSEMYKLDEEKNRRREQDRLEALYMLFHEKSEKLKQVEKQYRDLLLTHVPVDDQRESDEVRRLKNNNRYLSNENHGLRREAARLHRRIQDLGRDYDDVYEDLKEWKRRAQAKPRSTRKVEWSVKPAKKAAPTKKISPRGQ